ncbi:MAG: flagellar basal-body rod protein FlgG [Bacteriovoracaceae bacterium]|jgi:flagellar basal-body rod protein FlgG|nr:flagellar basal-body rod protein FlgG [Bacteriovoracaceae bacterium]
MKVNKKIIIIGAVALSGSSFAMMRALHTAASGMQAQEANVSTISNNIANVNTIGFKKGRTEFDDLAYETVQEPGANSSANTQYNVGVQIGSGAKVSAIRKEFSVGSPQLTNNPFDLMINGEGFFGIQMPNGELRYTRDGSFNVDGTGTLVNKQGYKVFPNLTFPPNTSSVSISEDGKVDAFVKGTIEPTNIGQIPIFIFVNPVGLKSTGMNLYQVTVASGAPVQGIAGESNAGGLMQGALETSNVSPMTEMTDLIRAQRAYEMNSKVMGVADQMMQTINNIR